MKRITSVKTQNFTKNTTTILHKNNHDIYKKI
jgi:hypothetical protein